MKSFISIIFLVICLFARADNVKVGNLYYSISESSKTAAVVKGEDVYQGDVVIPETFKYNGTNYTVIAIVGYDRWSGSQGAFERCENLSSITIPKTIERIGLSAFSGCSNLKAVYISDLSSWCNIEFYISYVLMGTHYDLSANPLCYAHSLFLNGEKITQLKIPDDVFQISEGSFIGGDFSSVIFHKNIQSLSRLAFEQCKNIKDVYCVSPKIQYTYHLNDNYYKLASGSHTFPLDIDAVLHVRERYVDNYINNNPELAEWKAFSEVEYIEGVDYKLSYIVDGEEYKSYFKEEGEGIIKEQDPTKVGYTFSGWSEIPETMPGHDVTVTGCFIPKKYKLTYKVDNQEYKSYEVEYNLEITPEEKPKKKGMTFSGWSEIPNTMPAHDVEVTGSFRWSRLTKDMVVYEVTDTLNNYCKVIYNGSASGEIKIDSVDIDGCYYFPATIADKAFYGCKNIIKVEIPATVTSIGERAFANIDKLTDVTIWAEDIPVTDRTAFENSYIEDYVMLHVPGSAIKKYQDAAPWKNFKEIVAIVGTEVIQTYKLTYTVDGETYKTVEVNEGDTIAPEAEPTKEGYTFSGWKDLPETMPGEDVTVSGTFTINKYKLTYIVDGSEYKVYEVEYGSSINPEDNLTKEGYTFSGWSDIPEKMPAGDVTVKGSFTVNTYKLVYMLDGEEYKSYNIDYGTAITTEEDPSKEGYTFSGWSEIPGTMPASDVTVTGYFTVNKYTIRYYIDGVLYKTYDIEYGSEIIPEDYPEWEGYEFSGWSWIPSKMPAENVTVTGSFARVRYDVGGASFEINDDGMTLVKAGDVSGDVVLAATVIINGKTYRVTVIGEGAFEGNTKITSLTVPEGINTILDNAFNGCSSLRKLMFAKGIKSIGSRAFANIGRTNARNRAASEPLTVECEAEEVPQAEAECFDGTPIESAILKVDDRIVSQYKTTSPWNRFGTIIGFNEAKETGIGSAIADEPGAMIFSIDGRRFDKPRKGMNIIRNSQGEAKKVIVK